MNNDTLKLNVSKIFTLADNIKFNINMDLTLSVIKKYNYWCSL